MLSFPVMALALLFLALVSVDGIPKQTWRPRHASWYNGKFPTPTPTPNPILTLAL